MRQNFTAKPAGTAATALLAAVGDRTPDWPRPPTSDDARAMSFDGGARLVVWRPANSNVSSANPPDAPRPTTLQLPAAPKGACFAATPLVPGMGWAGRACLDASGALALNVSGMPVVLAPAGSW